MEIQRGQQDGSQLVLFEQPPRAEAPDWFGRFAASRSVELDQPAWPDPFGTRLHRGFTELQGPSPRVLGLFSGAGGLDIGFHDAGFNVVESNELEPKFAATLERNSLAGGYLDGTNVVCCDIREYVPQVENIDFIIGGPPCQTFSAAGARAAGVNGTDDERGNLFVEYARILDQLKPRGFLFENVYRIVGAQGGAAWKRVQEAFESVGYTLHWRILDAADYGAPQFRERLIIVGLRDGAFLFPVPTHGPDSATGRPYYTATQALVGLPEVDARPLGGRHGHLLAAIPPGLNYSFYTEKLGHPHPRFAWRSKFSDYLYKADPETPVRTIKAQGGQYTGPFHWNSRPFTGAEFKRLQTFPDAYEIIGGKQRVVQQLGNSVPPQFARILALSVADQVFGRRVVENVDYLRPKQTLGFRQRKRALTKVYAAKAAAAVALMSEAAEAPGVDGLLGWWRPSLGADLRFKMAKTKRPGGDNKTPHVEVSSEGDRLILEFCNAAPTAGRKYNIELRARKPRTPVVGSFNSIELISRSSELQSLAYLYRTLESVVHESFRLDDLIQLFGYYQQERQVRVAVRHAQAALEADPAWRIIIALSAEFGLADLMDTSAAAEVFAVEPDSLMSHLVRLKKIGFEIRSKATNQQIPEGSILIPYMFPSLNHRSLQRLTSLT